MNQTTLDVPEKQVLCEYPNDQLQWHHRLLLQQIEGARWVCATPDHEIQTINLSDSRVRALRRNADFPDVQGGVYTFDAVDEQEMVEMRAEARGPPWHATHLMYARAVAVRACAAVGGPVLVRRSC